MSGWMLRGESEMFLVAVTKSDILNQFSKEKCETFVFRNKSLTAVFQIL